jgi:hypothetical protein
MALGAAVGAFDLLPDISNLATSIPAPDPPDWLEAGPIVNVECVGNLLFRRRTGANPLWMEEVIQKAQTEESVRKLKEAGVTYASIAFYLGFGLEAEKEEIAKSRKLAALMRRYGIRVGAYIGSTIMYETFLLEKPEAKEWFVPDYLGKPVIYNGHTWRKRVYFMHPGYREYIKRVVRVAIEDLQVDLIHFDNTSMQAGPEIFQHPLAIEDFRGWLQNRYAPAELKEWLGFSDVRFVEPPRCTWPVSTLDDPLFQEWTEFRCQQLIRYFTEMRKFIHDLNPKVAIEAVPNMGVVGCNTRWIQGVDYPALLSQLDIMWNEGGAYARTSPDGILMSAIRTYKMMRILNKRALAYTAPTHAGDGTFQGNYPVGIVQMAESMAYNPQCAGSVGGPLAGYDLAEQDRRYIKFFHDHFALYRGVQSVAEVAVLHSRASLGLNNDRPMVSFMLFTQTLIQAKVPFDLIFDEHLGNLSKYRVLVLADQECLADEQLELIRRYVREGGAVVATEHTSLYTERRRRRADFGLKDLFQVQAPVWSGIKPEDILSVGTLRHAVGRGRVAYLAEVKPAIEKPPAVPMSSEYWKLPTNWEDLVAAVRWAAGGQPTIEVKAPLTVTAELLRQPDTGKLFLHLINYDAPQTPRVENIEVRLRLMKEPKEVSLHSPDFEGVRTLAYAMREGVLTFTVPELQVYNVVAIS